MSHSNIAPPGDTEPPIVGSPVRLPTVIKATGGPDPVSWTVGDLIPESDRGEFPPFAAAATSQRVRDGPDLGWCRPWKPCAPRRLAAGQGETRQNSFGAPTTTIPGLAIRCRRTCHIDRKPCSR